jgi:hypothetical protein
MKNVLLHVGHGKTGSGYIQSFLVTNTEILVSNDITYPHHQSMQRAKVGLATSGNVDYMPHFADYIGEHAAASGTAKVLFSSEFLFRAILCYGDNFAHLCKYFDVAVILFIRDPLEHAISMYGQRIKRGRLTASLDEYVSSEYRIPWLVSDLIDIVGAVGARLIVRNYSNYRRCILRAFLLAINLDERGFTLPPVDDINRSLSPSEIRVQRAFNRYFGRQAWKFVSQPLVDNIPFSPRIDLTITRETYDKFCEKMADILPVVNQKLPDGEQYSLNVPTHFSDQASKDDEEFIYLSDRQMAVIASAVHAYIHNLETRNHNLEAKLLRSRSRSPYRRIRGFINKIDGLKSRNNVSERGSPSRSR